MSNPAEDPYGINKPLIMADGDTTIKFPCLTDIVKLGDAVFHDPQLPVAPQPSEPASTEAHVSTSDQIAQEVLSAIDSKLLEQVNKSIAPKLQQAMDETLAALLPQLAIHIEHIVHETLISEFERHGIPLNQSSNSEHFDPQQ